MKDKNGIKECKPMRKIAFSGLKGRKKDTFILSFVVILAFLFIRKYK